MVIVTHVLCVVVIPVTFFFIEIQFQITLMYKQFSSLHSYYSHYQALKTSLKLSNIVFVVQFSLDIQRMKSFSSGLIEFIPDFRGTAKSTKFLDAVAQRLGYVRVWLVPLVSFMLCKAQWNTDFSFLYTQAFFHHALHLFRILANIAAGIRT